MARASQFTTADVYAFTRELEKLHPDILNRVWHPGSGFLGNACRDLDAYNRARCLAVTVTLNSQPSTILRPLTLAVIL
jgi:hypothetical protein